METETLQNGMTKWLKEAMLGFFLRGNPDNIEAPAVLKLHLGTNDTGETWLGVPDAEAQVIEFAAPTTSTVTGTTFVSNINAIQYPTAQSDWGTIKSVGVFAYSRVPVEKPSEPKEDEDTEESGSNEPEYTVSTVGELIYWGRLLNPISVLQGGVVAFAPNTIRIEIA